MPNFLMAVLIVMFSMSSTKLEYQFEDAAQSALIHNFVECGHFEKALNHFDSMQEQSVYLSQSSLQTLLKACARLKCLEKGHEIHVEMAKRGYEVSLIVASSLLDMYAKNESLVEAQAVFDTMPVKDAVLWTALIAGYAEHGLAEEALSSLRNMQLEGIYPTAVTFVCSLKACSILKAIDKGQDLHAEVVREGLEDSLFLGNALINMYAKCHATFEAQEVFDEMMVHDVVSWTTLITGYTEGGFGEMALTCFEQMQQANVVPNVVTFVCILKSCSTVRAIDFGQQIYAEIVKEGFEMDFAIGNTAVDLYGKMGYFREAQDVFDNLPIRSVVTWNALIAGYVEQGLGCEALSCLEQMQQEGLSPNEVTFLCCLKACGDVGILGRGQQLHGEISEEGFEQIAFVGSALVNMYAKCGALAEAQEVFLEVPSPDVILWTEMISGFACRGESKTVCEVFERMRQEGVHPNDITCLSVLTACSHAGIVREGQDFFEVFFMECNIKLTIEHCNCMIDLLSRAGQIIEAVAIMENLPCEPDLMSCYSILAACNRWQEVELRRHVVKCALNLHTEHNALFILLSNLYADVGD